MHLHPVKGGGGVFHRGGLGTVGCKQCPVQCLLCDWLLRAVRRKLVRRAQCTWQPCYTTFITVPNGGSAARCRRRKLHISTGVPHVSAPWAQRWRRGSRGSVVAISSGLPGPIPQGEGAHDEPAINARKFHVQTAGRGAHAQALRCPLATPGLNTHWPKVVRQCFLMSKAHDEAHGAADGTPLGGVRMQLFLPHQRPGHHAGRGPPPRRCAHNTQPASIHGHTFPRV